MKKIACDEGVKLDFYYTLGLSVLYTGLQWGSGDQDSS